MRRKVNRVSCTHREEIEAQNWLIISERIQPVDVHVLRPSLLDLRLHAVSSHKCIQFHFSSAENNTEFECRKLSYFESLSTAFADVLCGFEVWYLNNINMQSSWRVAWNNNSRNKFRFGGESVLARKTITNMFASHFQRPVSHS